MFILAIATNDDGLEQKLRLMKNFGFLGFDNVIYLGTNDKMSEVSAAIVEQIVQTIRLAHREADLCEIASTKQINS